MLKNAMLVARTASCRVADSFSTRLKLIWPKSSLKNVKMSKKRVFCKKLRGVNGLKKEAILLTEGGVRGHGVRAKGVGVNARPVS